MTDAVRVDAAWRAAHPLPVLEDDADKNSRGRVLLVGGAEYVPGALRLTGEAALRVGAGKLQIGTVASIAMALGVLMPEAAILALPASPEGEIAPYAADVLADRVAACDALILGPGMMSDAGTAELVRRLLAAPRPGLSVLLDAAALTCSTDLAAEISAHGGRVVMTPHHGEMASLMGIEIQQVTADPAACALAIADRYKVLMVLKSSETLIATPDGRLFDYRSRCPGLATGGSGDVLAGAIGGLMARGADPLTAVGWGVWLHGSAGRRLAERKGAAGFLARDLSLHFGRLIEQGDKPPSTR